MPGSLKGLPGQSLIRQSYEALVVNVFRGLGGKEGGAFFDEGEGGGKGGKGGGKGGAAVVRTGDDALAFFGFGGTTVRGACGRQARILATYWWLTFCLLKAGRPKFAPLHRPPPPLLEAREEQKEQEGEAEAEAKDDGGDKEEDEAEASMAAIVG